MFTHCFRFSRTPCDGPGALSVLRWSVRPSFTPSTKGGRTDRNRTVSLRERFSSDVILGPWYSYTRDGGRSDGALEGVYLGLSLGFPDGPFGRCELSQNQRNGKRIVVFTGGNRPVRNTSFVNCFMQWTKYIKSGVLWTLLLRSTPFLGPSHL